MEKRDLKKLREEIIKSYPKREEIVDGVSLGYTENYIYTYIKGKQSIGEILDIELIEIFKNGMMGKIVK